MDAVKCLYNILARIEALQAGAIEVLMLNAENYVPECIADNFFALRHRRLRRPSVSTVILQGVTRDALFVLSR